MYTKIEKKEKITMNQIKTFFKKIKLEVIFSAILAIVLGILFIILPNESADTLCIVSGILLICAGIIAIVAFLAYGFVFGGYLLILGIALMLSGIFCLTYPEIVTGLLTIIFGIYIIVDGTTSLVDSIYCARAHIKGWFFLTLLAILSIVLGTIVMFGTFDTIMVFAGYCLIIDGICDIIEVTVFSHKIKTAKKKILENTDIIDM